jgi:phytoene/squalene synthetase
LPVSNLASSCAEMVRAADYDRYLSVLFAEKEKRESLFALYAFNFEVAKTAETVSEPTLGMIRLQWWRESVGEIFNGTPRRHEVVMALSLAIEKHDLPRALFDELLDAREQDLSLTPFGEMAELESYADATSGHVMRLAGRVLGAETKDDGHIRSLGIGYAITGLLRSLPHHAARRRIMFPVGALKEADLSEDVIYAGRSSNIRILIDKMIAATETHLRFGSTLSVPRGVLPAFLPAALIKPYLKIMKRRDFDPYREPVEISVPRKQLAMLGAMVRGRI